MMSTTPADRTRAALPSMHVSPAASAPPHAVAGVFGELIVLSAKLTLAQLAPLITSLYLSALVARLGSMLFSSYSLVMTINLTLFIAASSFLQVLYYVGGRAKGHEAEGEYDAAILAGVVLAAAFGIVAIALSCLIGIGLDALHLDAELVAGARWQGMVAAVGVAPPLLLVVYRVHASLNGRAGLVTLIAGSGAGFSALLATWAVSAFPAQPDRAACGVLLTIAAANWLMLLVALVSLRRLPQLGRPPGAHRATASRLRGSIARICSLGWPIGAVVLLDSLASLVTTLFVGRYWIAAVPVNAVVLLWVAMALVIPLGIAQAAVQRIAVTHAQGDRSARNRLAVIAMAMGVAYGAVVIAVFALLPIRIGALLLHEAAYEPENMAMLRELMVPGGAVLALQGVIVIGAAILRGIGQTRAPLAQALLGYTVIGTGSQALFGLVLGYGVVGIWWGLVLGFAVTALAVTWRCSAEFRRADPMSNRAQLHSTGIDGASAATPRTRAPGAASTPSAGIHAPQGDLS
jgi:MATE family multidrug resistance protein